MISKCWILREIGYLGQLMVSVIDVIIGRGEI